MGRRQGEFRKTADAADNGRTEKCESPEYRPPALETPPRDQADRDGERGEADIFLLTPALSRKASG